MTRQRHLGRTDIAIRLAGIGLGAIAWTAAMHLVALDPAQPGIAAFALAATVFLAASFGAALLFLGHHVLDEIAIGARWHRLEPSCFSPDCPTPGARPPLEFYAATSHVCLSIGGSA